MGQISSSEPQNNNVLYSVPVSLSKISETGIYRSPNYTDKLVNTYNSNILTLQDQFLDSVKKYENNNFLGKKDQNKNEYTWWTYRQVMNMSQKVGSAILDRCLFNETEGLNTIGIFSKNCLEWAILEYSIAIQNNTVNHIINECNLETVFCSEDQIPLIMDNEKIKNIICFSSSTQMNEYYQNQLQSKNKQLIFFKDLLTHEKVHPFSKVNSSDVYTICYTSGTTTNTSKGAIITHANCISSLTPYKTTTDEHLKIREDDVYYSVLPLSHIYERDVCLNIMANGASIGFASKDLASQKQDLEVLQPTIYCSVPRLYNRIYQSIIDKVQNFEDGIQKKLFEYALNFKTSQFNGNGCHNSILDELVFKKFKKTFGGRTRVLFSGGAPLNQKVLKFLQAVLCVPIIQGYGQSESTGVALSTQIQDNYHGSVGGPSCNMEFKLIDCPELNYFCIDQDQNGRSRPRGEILLRGGKVFKGYFKDQISTDKIIDKDGWLHTGDIVELHENGAVNIIDRRNNIFKLPIGEYVIPEKIENIYSVNPCISEIFVHGSTDKNFLVAVIVPDFNYFQGVLELDSSITQDSAEYAKIVQSNPIFKKLISEGLSLCDNELLPYERIQQYKLEAKSFQNLNLLTSTGKLQRIKSIQHFQEQISEMYQFHDAI